MPLIALTRELSPRIAECELTHLARSPIDVARARAEHAAYERALQALGCDVRRVSPAPELPDGVFVEDAVVVLDELAVACRPGAASRRAEVASVAAVVECFRPTAAVVPPGTLDGGDVLRDGRRLFVGRGARSNDAGIAGLATLTSPHGYEVIPVSFSGCLHLKTAATLVAAGVALVNPLWVDPAALAPLRTVAVDPGEPMAANALRVEDAVLFPAEFPRTRARLEAAGVGVRVVTVPFGELARAEGGLTCCSVIFEAAATLAFPSRSTPG